ncbi:MAG TPA: ABC transporter permease [Vicinamibacterales bacterium]|nr:ABC transporter permease [Vicinamibacterales bacterium]
MWIRRWLDEIVQDVRYALRTLRKSPGFTSIAILTIALGVGANTAIFSVVNAAILRPLRYPQPHQLMFLTTGKVGTVSPAEYWELTEINQSFSVVGAFVAGEANLSARDRPRRATSATVNAELLESLAVPPERGRWFRREETSAGGPAVVILSNELWQSAFGAREDLVGQSIEIDGVSREVIGIMPSGFDLMDKRIQLWLPLQLAPTLRQFRASHFLSVLGRLKNGVVPEQAKAELASLMATWGERVGASGHVFTPGGHVMQMEPVLDEVVGSARRAFWLLQAGVGLVLLIACANLASLLMVRAEVRRSEVAIRTALGAGRRRLLAQFLAEGLVLLVPGGALGLVVAWAGVRALTVAYPESVPRVADIGIDPAVLAFTLLVSALTGVVFGLVPLRYLSERVSGRLLNDRTPTTATRSWVRRTLVASEVALAVVLVVSAGLMVRTVLNLMNVDTGFERSRLVTFGLALPATYPTFEQRVQFYGRLIDRFGAMPGISAVAAVSGLPPQRERNLFGTAIEDYSPTPERSELVDYYQTVTSSYFEAMRIPIVQGRAFQATDRVGGPVAVVNEAFVRTFWKDVDAVGRRLRPGFGDNAPWLTVIGVAKDVKQAGVDKPTGTELYMLLDQLPRIFPGTPAVRLGNLLGDRGRTNIMLRSALPAATLQGSITNAVREADPSLPIIRMRDMEEVVRDTVRRPRMLMQLFAAFAGFALLLAAIGTYGVLSYVVTQRRREIGIRMALGAERARVLRSVMGQGLQLTCIGLVAGLSGALVLTRLMETLLFGVRSSDPATLAGVAALITAVAAAASLVPAVRATRVDPMVALRDE